MPPDPEPFISPLWRKRKVFKEAIFLPRYSIKKKESKWPLWKSMAPDMTVGDTFFFEKNGIIKWWLPHPSQFFPLAIMKGHELE